MLQANQWIIEKTFDCVIFDLTWTKNSINDNIFFYSYDMYSKCHSVYLKWTYFCIRHMGAISHWESCCQKYIINSIDSSTIFAKFMKMSISCLLKSIVSIKYFESDFLKKS